MKHLYLLTAAAALVVTTAAQADPLAGAYGNTITVTQDDGVKFTAFFNPDKTWEEHHGATVIKGTFELKDNNQLCKTITNPAPVDPAKATSCEVAADHKVGDTWTETSPNGKQISITITAGR